MFHLFNKKNEILKLYQDLAPGERIKKLFEEKLGPFLTANNFRFVKSKNLFKRQTGTFTQEIYVAKDKWNRGDEVCAFWLIFIITAGDFNAWHQKEYGTLPMNNIVASFYHNHLKNWKTEFLSQQYDLSKQDNNKVFEEIKVNIENLVFPLFDKYSTYETSADTLMERKEYWQAAKIYDYYSKTGNFGKAKNTLLAGEQFFSTQTEPNKQLLEAFELRLKQI